jgi:hypothetical protein
MSREFCGSFRRFINFHAFVEYANYRWRAITNGNGV